MFGWIGEKFKLQMVVVAILSMMAIQGVTNLQSQWGIIGEFSNFPQEELLEWIKDNTSPSEKSDVDVHKQMLIYSYRHCA